MDFTAYYRCTEPTLDWQLPKGHLPPIDDFFDHTYSSDEVLTSCLFDSFSLQELNQRYALICCGHSCGDELLAVDGILFHILRRLTAHGELTITALDVCDEVGYDMFSFGTKVPISDKSVSGVTARMLERKSNLWEIEQLVNAVRLRWETVCGSLLIDIRGAINVQVVGLRWEQGSHLYRKLCGLDDGNSDSLCRLMSKVTRKGAVRLIRYVRPSSKFPSIGGAQLLALYAEARIYRSQRGNDLLLQHTLTDLQTKRHRYDRIYLRKEVYIPQLASELESVVEEMTTATKRIKKARIHLNEVKSSLNSKVVEEHHASSPVIDDQSPKADANHAVLADFYRFSREVLELHSAVLECVRASNSLLAKSSVKTASHKSTSPPSVLNFIHDVVYFAAERAVLMSEGVVSRNESYAWIDVNGCSDKLKSPESWNAPLHIQIKTLFPRVTVEFHDKTTFESDDENIPVKKSSNISKTASTTQFPTETTPPSAQNTTAQKPVSSSVTDLTQRKLSITKKHDTEEADKKYLMAVYDSLTLVQDVTKYLKAGTIMIKHGRIGSPHPRLFWVSSVVNKTALLWVDPDKRSASAKTNVPLTDICSVILGPFSKVFKRNPIGNENKDFFLSFTLTLRDDSRTVDIVAPTLPDFEAWVLGISHMAHVDPFWGKRLTLPNDQFTARLSEQEKALCETSYIFPSAYVAVKDRIVDLRDEVRQHLRLFGNNAEQAFVALGGIHLPQVNHKGAILMTKGELRHYCSAYNIDIFRVCEIWRVFNSQDLVYDPSFVPATNFGVTQRKGLSGGK